MKQIFIVLLIFLSLDTQAQRNADDIVGKWMKIPNKDMVIEVFKHEGEYRGRISWTKENDPKKPAGFMILEKLRFNAEDNAWEDGKIHDPASGSTYSAIVRLDTTGTLEVHGYKGMKFLGKKKYFQRVE